MLGTSGVFAPDGNEAVVEDPRWDEVSPGLGPDTSVERDQTGIERDTDSGEPTAPTSAGCTRVAGGSEGRARQAPTTDARRTAGRRCGSGAEARRLELAARDVHVVGPVEPERSRSVSPSYSVGKTPAPLQLGHDPEGERLELRAAARPRAR